MKKIFKLLIPTSKCLLTTKSAKDGGDKREVNDMFSIKDAFIFCPSGNTIMLQEILPQGIFASEYEMDQMEETKDSIFNKIVTITFEDNDAKRSMKQAIDEYLMDVAVHATEYSSALNVKGISVLQKTVLLKTGSTIA